ncbi:class I SAM-dependent methyltransferase [Desulfovibrio sp.]|uniref:class I SAM-dependent methyltransferase n=1 Tax=Desulfovibrio sp. TaxID=885 RepID=UPI0025C19D90|nr:class I SAM-dependent methyltransferase [Desulfovibrio sp.]
MNNNAHTFFEKMAKSDNLAPNSVKLAKNSDFSDIDTDFIRKHANSTSTVLDLGSGTGLIVNKLYPHVKKIIAVEPFCQFTQYITKSANIDVVNCDAASFLSDDKFDIILLFAVMHYVDETEAIAIYKKYINYLSKNGKIIIKNQFGVHDDVTINGFSEELQENYFAQYRFINKEVKLLQEAGFSNVDVVDIYPPKCNRWENTHFYALVAEK